jgi:hypothetical protein
LNDVPYCTVSVRLRIVKATSSTVAYCAVSWLYESGTVSNCNELERIGIVITNSDICDLLTFGSESRGDLLAAVVNIELILCFLPYND